MRISIRYQILGLVTAILLGAMAAYLSWASRSFSADKVAYVYDVNRILAQTLSEEVRTHVLNLVDKLQYFSAEHARTAAGPQATADRTGKIARSLFDSDEDVLALELFEKREGRFQSTFRYLHEERLAALNLRAKDLDETRRLYPVPPDQVQAERIVLRNSSYGPDALVRLGGASDDGRHVVVADLRPDRFLRIFLRSRNHRVYLVDERGEALVHPTQANLVLNHENLAKRPLVRLALESPLPIQTREESEGDEAVLGTYAHVDLGRRMSVLVEVPKAEALRAAEELERQSLLFGLFVVAVAFFASILLSRRLAAPLRKLEETMTVISTGQFGVQVPIESNDEIGTLAGAFNRMSRELSEREARLMETHAQLVQSEKLSALGEMSAGVVHEVKNPMVGIVGFAELGRTVGSLDEAREYFGLIYSDAQRANGILQDLLAFARPEKIELLALDLNEVVAGAVKLCHHQLQMRQVRVEQRFATDLPTVRGNVNQLRQVLLNLMMNAGHAMEGRPTRVLTVSTARGADRDVEIRVKDTGVGMTEAIRQKLFQPFFTTKPRGTGTGLGLSVSRSIIQLHRGDISVLSEPDVGSEFVVRIPEAGAAPPVDTATDALEAAG